MRAKRLQPCVPDPGNVTKLIDGLESPMRVAPRDDAGGEGRTDPVEGVQLFDACRRQADRPRCHPGCRGLLLWRGPNPADTAAWLKTRTPAHPAAGSPALSDVFLQMRGEEPW